MIVLRCRFYLTNLAIQFTKNKQKGENIKNIVDMHCWVNEIYTQWDEGEIKSDEVIKLLLKNCKDFIKHNENKKEKK